MSELPVVFVAFDGVQSIDVAGPYEVFASAGDAAAAVGRRGGYRVRVASAHGGPVRTESGLELGTVPLPGLGERIDTLVLPGGIGSRAAGADQGLIAFVAAAASRCRRVAAVCTGAFIAAAAGLLDGRRVTTHWAAAAELQADYPALEVDPDPLYIRDGQMWTSAGVTAGIDLALALVGDDLGTDVAQTLARWMVMFLHRPGGQTQFATPVWVPRAERSAVRAVQNRVESAPGGDHRLPALAAAASMSADACWVCAISRQPERAPPQTRAMTIQLINPADLPPQATYTQVVLAAGTTTVFIAGQEPEDVHGNSVAPGDLAAQARQVYANLGRALSAAGVRPDQVAKITIYVVDYRSEYLPVIEQARLELFGDHKPADTLIGVARLARPEFLIEVDAIAVK